MEGLTSGEVCRREIGRFGLRHELSVDFAGVARLDRFRDRSAMFPMPMIMGQAVRAGDDVDEFVVGVVRGYPVADVREAVFLEERTRVIAKAAFQGVQFVGRRSKCAVRSSGYRSRRLRRRTRQEVPEPMPLRSSYHSLLSLRAA